jgi:hypothetical protein
MEQVHASLKITQAGRNNFLEIPPSEYLATSFHFFAQVARYIRVLVVQSTLNDDSWDTALAWQTADVLQFIDEMLGNIQVISGNGSNDGLWSADGFLATVLRIFAGIRAWCASKLADGQPAFAFDSLDSGGFWMGGCI